MKCDVVDGSSVNGLKQPKLYIFVLNEPIGYKLLSELEPIQYKN